jgi:DNA polymerase III delta prime subunit
MNYEKHFENYLHLNEEYNLHPDLFQTKKDKKDKNISSIKNTIFYGPSGVGKYTQVLKRIKNYSPSELKYEKKMTVTYNKQSYLFKISDIHYEIDMSLLGCNAKIIWHEIYHQLIDILSAKQNKIGILLCKNFQDIHIELLENFYHYMTNINNRFITIYYYIITEQISFIPMNILQVCQIVSIPRPNKNTYKKCLQKNTDYYQIKENNKSESNPINIKQIDEIKLETVQNIKELYFLTSHNFPPEKQYQIISDKIIQMIETKSKTFSFLKFRDLLYELLIYHINIYECIWYIVTYFIEKNSFSDKEINKLLIKTYVFFQYFNNNYRPIYHLENYFIANFIHF